MNAQPYMPGPISITSDENRAKKEWFAQDLGRGFPRSSIGHPTIAKVLEAGSTPLVAQCLGDAEIDNLRRRATIHF